MDSCNICCEDIEEDRLVTLKCNPKHFFCYDCISDWYIQLTKLNSSNNEKCTCPICKKKGGYLPLLLPHTVKVEYIHIGPLFEPNVCYVKDCNCMASNSLTSQGFNHNFDILHTSKHIPFPAFFCEKHFLNIGRSNEIYTLNDDSIIQSKIIYCQCIIKYDDNIYGKYDFECNQKINFLVTHEDVKYGMCKHHILLYKNSVQLPIFGKDYMIQFGTHTGSITINDIDNIITGTITESEKSLCIHKMLGRKFGYCMKPLMDGCCTTKSHNPSTKSVKIVKKKKSPLGDSSEIQSLQCTSQLKNGKGNCTNNAKYGDKCGIHKDSIS